MAQLAATAANRITPLGLGGAAVNIRSLTRRGPDLPGAVAAVASLAILGALADVLLRAAILIARQLSPPPPGAARSPASPTHPGPPPLPPAAVSLSVVAAALLGCPAGS